jgi:ABC-type branched-subunit amino acid transport system substrate-binding protein
MEKRFWLIICLILAVFLLAGQGYSLAQSEKVIKVGVINPLTGPAAPWGLNTKCALEATQIFLNDRGGITVKGQKYKVELIFIDDKYTVAGGRAAAEKLIYSDKVQFLVGSIGAEPISAWAPLATKEKILAVVGGPTWNPRPDWPYVFRVTANDAERAEALHQLMKEKYGAKSVLYIMSDDLVGKNAKETAQKYHKKDKEMKVLDYVMVPPGTKDFYPFISKALKSNPDYVHCKLPPGSVALIVKQARELGYKGKIGYPTSMPGNLGKWQEIAGVEASIGFIGIMSNLLDYSPYGLEYVKVRENHYAKVCPAFQSTDVSYTIQLDILLKAIEKAQSFDVDAVAKVIRTTEFQSFIKFPLRASGEKTYGIKNHITVPVSYNAISGPKKVEYLKSYQIMTP